MPPYINQQPEDFTSLPDFPDNPGQQMRSHSQSINGPSHWQDISAGQHISPVNFDGNAHMAQQHNASLFQDFARPYDLAFHQNQYPQNGGLALANKQVHQQQYRGQQHLQPLSTIQNDAVRRPSPSHPPMPSQHFQNGMTNPVQQNNAPLFSLPLQEQAMYLRNVIQSLNNNLAAQRVSQSDVDPMTEAHLASTYMAKREAATKMLNNVLAQIRAQNGDGQGQMPWIQQPQPQQGPSQPSFDAVSIPRNSLGGIQPTQQHLQHQPVYLNQPGGQNPLALQTNPQANHLNVAGSSFPSQPMSAPPNTASFNVPSAGLAQQVQEPGTGVQNPMLQMIPPLEKSRFEFAFKGFCNTKQIKIDQRLLSVNNRPIDLYMLHCLVMMEGGEIKVQLKDLWSVIAGRMGFVQFPGTTESSPVIAQQLEYIYRQCLADFDRAYIADMLDLRVRNGLGVSLMNPNQLNMIVAKADEPISQLRAQGLSEHTIQFIETNRPHLRRLRRDREGLHNAMEPAVAEHATQGQANGAPHVNQLSGFQPPFLQPGPQNNLAQSSGHNVEVRQQQVPHQANANEPSKEQIQHALTVITKFKQETMDDINNRPSVNVPAEHKHEYITLIDQLSPQAAEIDKKLVTLYIYTRRDQFVHRLIVLICAVQHQRSLLASPNPRFFVSLENLRVMDRQLQQAGETCSQLFAALIQQGLQIQQQPQIQPGARPANARNSFPLDAPQIRPPGALLPSPSLQPSQPTPLAQQSTPKAKRPREEDEIVLNMESIGNNTNVAKDLSPPKRVKTNWESPSSEIETKLGEDTPAFSKQIPEIFNKIITSEGQRPTLYDDLSDGSESNSLGEDVIGRDSSPSTGLAQQQPQLTSIAQDSTPALSTASQTAPLPAFTESDDDDGLAVLKHFTLFDALHNSSQAAQDLGSTCPPDTRDHIIETIQRWIDNPSAERLLWFYGYAGGGKSAILQAVAHASTAARVAAVFYFRSHPRCNDGNRLFTTLAWQLATSIPAIKDHLSFALNEDPDLPARDIETQFQELIVRPFSALNEGTSAVQQQGPVVIIAGIDQCPDESLQQRILKVVETGVDHISFPLRFLISSTPDTQIEETINHFETPVLRIYLEKPFTESDESYLEILSRVPNQDFLKTFLGLLVGRCSISRDILGRDDPMLMNVSRVALEEALREMRPIIKFEPYIDVHHQSFLDFLQDSLRSSQYHVNKRAGLRRYLELMTKLLVRHATRLTNHGNDHFTPEFGNLIKHNPQVIELDIQDWEQSLSPLLNTLAKLLVPSNVDSLLNKYCQQCQFFQITYDILKYFKSLREEEDPVVEKCLKSLEEIKLYSGPEHQNFDVHFGRIICGSAAVVGFLMAVLAHQREYSGGS